jgi:hypothetical protein
MVIPNCHLFNDRKRKEDYYAWRLDEVERMKDRRRLLGEQQPLIDRVKSTNNQNIQRRLPKSTSPLLIHPLRE